MNYILRMTHKEIKIKSKSKTEWTVISAGVTSIDYKNFVL